VGSLTARLSKSFARQPRSVILIEMIAALIFIAVVDYLSGSSIRLLPFYAVPIFVVAWFIDKKTAVTFAVFAGLLSLTADWLDNDPDLVGWIRIWEVTRHLGSCVCVALVASLLRSKSDSAAARIALLEHSQQLEREIVGISDAERCRIGQDLHDGLCQYLAALGCSATSLRDDLEKLKLKQEAGAAGELAELLQDAVVQTRDLARSLIPAQVGRMGLVSALESLSQSVARLQGVECAFEFNGSSKTYEDHSARHLYRIAQEAISNAIRHGGARKIVVSLKTTERLTVLRIQDDGVGLKASAANDPGMGMGLNIMRHRASQSGGVLRIEEPPGGGTLVSCTVATGHEISQVAAA